MNGGGLIFRNIDEDGSIDVAKQLCFLEMFCIPDNLPDSCHIWILP
jgi:hypothetical protein